MALERCYNCGDEITSPLPVFTGYCWGHGAQPCFGHQVCSIACEQAMEQEVLGTKALIEKGELREEDLL